MDLASALRCLSLLRGSEGSGPLALKRPFPSLKINYNAVHKKRNGVSAVHYDLQGDLTLSQGRSRNLIDRVVWVTTGRRSGAVVSLNLKDELGTLGSFAMREAPSQGSKKG